LQIIHERNAPIHALLNTQAVQAIADDKVPGLQGARAVVLFERMIQTNEWLKNYHVTLSL
jgi:hypothetical protein